MLQSHEILHFKAKPENAEGQLNILYTRGESFCIHGFSGQPSYTELSNKTILEYPCRMSSAHSIKYWHYISRCSIQNNVRVVRNSDSLLFTMLLQFQRAALVLHMPFEFSFQRPANALRARDILETVSAKEWQCKLVWYLSLGISKLYLRQSSLTTDLMR